MWSCLVWNDWSEWSECSATCEAGTKRKSRTCENGAPGQIGCTGETDISENCNEGACNPCLRDSTICTDFCTWGGGGQDDYTCSCPTGKELASDDKTCVSKADADRHCPTSLCWRYELNPETGKNHCKLKLGF